MYLAVQLDFLNSLALLFSVLKRMCPERACGGANLDVDRVRTAFSLSECHWDKFGFVGGQAILHKDRKIKSANL